MKRILFVIVITVYTISVCAQGTYRMAGPYEVIARDGEHRNTKGGSERDMKASLDYAIAWCESQKKQEPGLQLLRNTELANRYPNLPTLSPDSALKKSLEIINAYAGRLQRVDGHDAPLCLIQGYEMVLAMIELRDYRNNQWDNMLRRAFVPTMQRFEADSPYANGNWGAIVNRMRMACAILLNDSVMYNASVDYFLHANDNGSLPHYIAPSGQCQETGRDQGHVQLGLEALCQTCELAWRYKGDDLWGALDNRLLKGVEYTARYNVGVEVPFETWNDCTGLYTLWTSPGEMGRGKLWDIYRLPYQHFHSRKGLSMPYTEKALKVMGNEKQKAKNEMLAKQKEHCVHAYPAPQGAPLKHDYEVYIQPRGAKEWTRIDTYMARVNALNPETPNLSGHKVSEISYAMFDFEGDVFVKVVCKKRKFQSARIRPDYRGVIANIQNDSVMQFMLFQPENVSIEFDGDITSNLLLFTSQPAISKEQAESEAKRQGRQFVYVAPGYYDKDRLKLLMPQTPEPAQQTDKTPSSAPQTTDVVRIPSSTTVYLAPGTYIDGTLAMEDVHDVSIVGRGICRPGNGYEGAHVHRSQRIVIDGMVVCTCPIGESSQVTLHDVRSISHPSWGDGLNVFGGCHHILFDRVFCRNSDDCTTVYATRKGFTGSVSHVTMRNSTLWADVAHPIMIGIHGMGNLSETSDSITHIYYENIDILGQAEAQIDYQGCLGINCGDNNVVKDVVFDNIRIEEIEHGALLHIKTFFNEKYCTATGRSVEYITLRNIRYGSASHPAKNPNLSIISGYDPDHMVRNIRFEGLKINGQLIYDTMPGKPSWYKTTDFAGMYVNNHVQGLIFEK